MATETPKLALPPSLVGRYELIKELAVGGMGIIYLARDLSDPREVVFKFIAPELLGDEETQIRFINEAKLTGKLDHPSIVKLFAAGQEAGLLYIIYEYLDGSNLKTLMEKYSIYPIGKALDILIKVSEGIAYAHSHKILHRDIKPENILVGPLGDWVKLIDFGIAKSIEDSQKLTQTGFIIGTPEYLSPEQAVGHKASYFSDQYAIAVLAYEMLTGHLPIEEANTVDLFTKKIRGAWVPVRERRPEIPAELAKTIEKAMATEAERRYPSMDDLLRDLKDYASRRANISARSATEASGLFKRGAGGTPEPSGIHKRGAPPPRPESSGVHKRQTPQVGESSGISRRQNREGKAGEPTIQMTQRAGFSTWQTTTEIVRRFTEKIPSMAALGGVSIPIVLVLLWFFWPFSSRGPALPRMVGDLTILHQLDGTTISWNISETGKPVLKLEPGKGTRPLLRQGRDFAVKLSASDLNGVERIDLQVKQGESVEAQMKGIPLLGVRMNGDGVSIDVPPIDAGSPVLAVWTKASERNKKEMSLKARQGRLSVEALAIEPSGDTFIQLLQGTGPEKEPLTFVQRIQPPADFLKVMEEKLESLRVIELLAGKKARPDENAWEQSEWLDRKTRDLIRETREDTLASVPEIVDVLKEIVTSPGSERARLASFFARCQEACLLVEMARRSGFAGSTKEFDKLMSLPWPFQVTYSWKEVTGAGKTPEKSLASLAESSTTHAFKAVGVARGGMKSARLTLRAVIQGIGTYLRIVIGGKWSFYAWGPGDDSSGTKGYTGAIELAFPADLLTDGDNTITIETHPVVGLVKTSQEVTPLPPALVLIDRSGVETSVKVERVP